MFLVVLICPRLASAETTGRIRFTGMPITFGNFFLSHPRIRLVLPRCVYPPFVTMASALCQTAMFGSIVPYEIDYRY